MLFKKLLLIFSLIFISSYIQAEKKELTQFFYFISKSHFRAVQEMLEKNPSLALETNDDGITSLHMAESFGITRLLLENGADPRAEDNYKRTPLHFITLLEDIKPIEKKDIVELLFKAGADLNAPDKKGIVPLYYADDFEIAEFLLENGADPKFKSNYNILPNFHRTSHYFIMFLKNIKPFERVKFAKLFLDHGIDPNFKDYFKRTPLQHMMDWEYSKNSDKIELIKLFLDYEADPYASDMAGTTPIDLTEDPEIIKLFQEASGKKRCAQTFNSLGKITHRRF